MPRRMGVDRQQTAVGKGHQTLGITQAVIQVGLEPGEQGFPGTRRSHRGRQTSGSVFQLGRFAVVGVASCKVLVPSLTCAVFRGVASVAKTV